MKPQPFDDEAPTTRVTTGDPVAAAEAEVQRTRALVMRSAMALRDAVVQRTDWRHAVARQPVACVGVAFALGLWLGYRR